MEGPVFPRDAVLVCDLDAELKIPDVIRALQGSGFKVRIRDVPGYKDVDHDLPCLYNGRHVVLGIPNIFDFARRCEPNLF